MRNPEGYTDSEIEVSPEKGRNIFIRASFERHGEKVFDPDNFDTRLTEKGKERSVQSGKKREPFDVIKGFSSDTERTKETLENIIANSPNTIKKKSRIRQELAFLPYSKQFGDWMNRIKKETIGDYSKLTPDELKEKVHVAAEKQTDAYFELRDRRFDEQTFSPVENAAMIARRAELYLHMSERLRSGSTVELVNTSHDFPILAFLKEVMVREVGGEKVRGFGAVSEIGGPLDYNEKFDLDIKTDENGAKLLSLHFRGQTYEIDEERMHELVEISKALIEGQKSKKSE